MPFCPCHWSLTNLVHKSKSDLSGVHPVVICRKELAEVPRKEPVVWRCLVCVVNICAMPEVDYIHLMRRRRALGNKPAKVNDASCFVHMQTRG